MAKTILTPIKTPGAEGGLAGGLALIISQAAQAGYPTTSNLLPGAAFLPAQICKCDKDGTRTGTANMSISGGWCCPIGVPKAWGLVR